MDNFRDLIIGPMEVVNCLGGGGARGFFLINNFVGKMGKVNKWPQGMVEIQPILR